MGVANGLITYKRKRSSNMSDDELQRIKMLRRTRTVVWCSLATASTVMLSVFTIITLRWDRPLLSISVFETIVLFSAGICCICGCLRDDHYLLLPFMFLAVLIIIIRFIVVILALIAAFFPDNYKNLLKYHNPWSKDQIGEGSLRIPLFIISIGSAIVDILVFLSLIRVLTYYVTLVEQIQRDQLLGRGVFAMGKGNTETQRSGSSGASQPPTSGAGDHSVTAENSSNSKASTKSVSRPAGS